MEGEVGGQESGKEKKEGKTTMEKETENAKGRTGMLREGQEC